MNDQAVAVPPRPAEPSEPPGPVSGRQGALRALLPHAAFLVIAFMLVGWHVEHYEEISPTDEAAQVDYVQRIPHIPDAGQRLTQDSMREWACRGFPPQIPFEFPPCDSKRFVPDQFPGSGFSYTGSTPPAYYLATAVVARPVAALTGASLFEVARWCGALWLAALMSVSYLVALRLGIRLLPAAGAAVLVASTSNVVTSAATIGPDIATAVAGGLVVLAAVHHDGSRRGLALLLAATALAAGTKLTTFTAVGVAMLMLLIVAVPRAGYAAPWRLRHGVGAAAAVFAVFGALSAAWGAVYSAQARIDPNTLPINAVFVGDHLALGEIWQLHLFPFLEASIGNWLPDQVVDAANSHLQIFIAGLHMLAILVLACSLAVDRRAGALGVGALVLAVAGPFVLLFLNFYVNGLQFAIVGRYGYGLLPLYAVAVAWLCRDRGPGRAVAVMAAVSVLNILT